jgi:hypothetical protein
MGADSSDAIDLAQQVDTPRQIVYSNVPLLFGREAP